MNVRDANFALALQQRDDYARRLDAIRKLCDELDRDAEADPNGGFGPGMQCAVREIRAVLGPVPAHLDPEDAA